MTKKSKKGANKKQAKKNNTKQKKQQQPKKRDYRREKTYALSTNSGNNRKLEESINLFIGKKSDIASEGGDDNNDVERQISKDAQISVQSTRSTRNRQLPIKYR
jgi:hypothetical protein